MSVTKLPPTVDRPLVPAAGETTAPPRGAARVTGPIVVATNGATSADAALRVARALAEHLGVAGEVEVVSVLEPLPVYTSGFAMELPPPDFEQSRIDALARGVRRQLVEMGADSWPVSLQMGQVGRTIARVAQERGAGLIVLGLGRHRPIDRLLGSETALHAIRSADAPVLAVATPAKGLPRRAVVAVDFSRASLRAAHTAMALLAEGGTLHLVHVRPPLELQSSVAEGWDAIYREGVAKLFEKLRAELAPDGRVTIDATTVFGEPAPELLGFAQRVEADLIAAGAQGHGLFDRLVVGSVTTALLRGASCSVLVLPAERVAARERRTPLARARGESAVLPRERWAAELQRFTEQNLGRRTALEVDEPALGAQAQESNYRLLGVAFDHVDGRIDVMLGDRAGGSAHLTHAITDPVGVDVLRDADGRVLVLRIAQAGGQTLLRFLD